MNNQNYEVYTVNQSRNENGIETGEFYIMRQVFEDNQQVSAEYFVDEIQSWDDAIRELEEIGEVLRTENGQEWRTVNSGTIRVYAAQDDEF